MADIHIRYGNIPRDYFELIDYSDHFKIIMDDFFVIYAINIDRFYAFLKYIHNEIHLGGVDRHLAHREFKSYDDDGEPKDDLFPGIHIFLRKILSQANIDYKEAELDPPAGVFQQYQFHVYPPSCHVDSHEDHDMCLYPNYKLSYLRKPEIVPHTAVNANAERTDDTHDLVYRYCYKLFNYVNQHYHILNYKFKVFQKGQTPDGAIVLDKELVFDRGIQGWPETWVDDIIWAEKKFKSFFRDEHGKTRLIDYQRIFYSFCSGHQGSDFSAEFEEGFEDNIDFD